MYSNRRALERMIAVLAIAIITCAPLLPGCSSGEVEAEPVAEAPAVDPRFASPEALIKHFNELNASSALRLDAEIVLYYAENQLQREMIRVMKADSAWVDYSRALNTRFGHEYDFESRFFSETATVQEVNGQRAVALAVGSERSRELHLIEYENRWWISGYTLEYDPMPIPFDLTHEEMLKASDTSLTILPGLVRRINAGEFEDEDEVLEAFAKEMEKRPKF